MAKAEAWKRLDAQRQEEVAAEPVRGRVQAATARVERLTDVSAGAGNPTTSDEQPMLLLGAFQCLDEKRLLGLVLDLVDPDAVLHQDLSANLLGLANGKLEDRCTVLVNVVHSLFDRFVRSWPEATTRRHTQGRSTGAIDLVGEVENTQPIVRSWRQDGSTGSVTEKHAGCAVMIVDDRRHHVGTDDEGVLMHTTPHHLRTHRERVGET